MTRVRYDKLPEHMQSGARLYIEEGIRPGSFLTAVLENNLTQAVQFADSTNRNLLSIYVEWMHWDIPSLAHGSPQLVSAWMNQGGLEGPE